MRNNVLVEIQKPDGTWINVSQYRLNRVPVIIDRGRADGENTTPPAQATLTLKNDDGLFSPRNPNSPLFGVIKRNTPLKISRGVDAFGMVTTGAGAAECNDSAALSFLGDLDVRVDLQPRSDVDWNTAGFDLASKFSFTVGQLGWSFIVVGGFLRLAWWPTGTTPAISSDSTVKLSAGSDRRAVRATLDVNNGAAGNTVTFYTAPTMAGPWTQLGAAVVKAGTTTLFDTPSKVRVGAATQATLDTHGHAEATFYAAEVRNGIGGTVVASPNFEGQPLDPAPFTSSNFTDTQGNVWSFNPGTGTARTWWGESSVRMVGEIASLPPKWDQSHKDKSIPITVADVTRRYQQGKQPVNTSLRDYVLKDQTALLSYFPLDGVEGTQYSRNIANTNKNTEFFYNEPLPDKPIFKYGVDMGAPWIGSGMELERTNTTGRMRGDTVSWDSNVAFDFLWQSPALGELSVSLRDYNGQIWTLDLNDIADSGLGQVSYTDPATGPIGFATFAVPEVNDTDLHIGRLQITNNGANIDYAVYIDGTVRKTGTQAGANTNGSAYFTIQYAHANTGQVAVNLAHLITWANASAGAIPAAADVADAALGFTGETAGRRLERICDDAGLPLVTVGDLDDTTRMGPQFAESRMAQLRDCEATDFGMLATDRESNSLWYRTRTDMYNQPVKLTLDYSARVLYPPFEPVDDDTFTRNSVTVSRRNGGSYQIVKTDGPLAAIDPPVGIGQYEDDVTVNVETDAQLAQIAAFRLNQGTLDAARFSSLTVNLQALAGELGQPAADALMAAVLDTDLTDRCAVTNLDAADIPEDLDLLVLGYHEEITNVSWMWEANCAPADLFQVAVFGEDRYGAVGSTLTAGINAAATSFSVSVARTIWTRTSFPWDININGERMTVGGVSGTGPTQTFNPVTRAVNGVSKSHAAGSTVQLWQPARFAL